MTQAHLKNVMYRRLPVLVLLICLIGCARNDKLALLIVDASGAPVTDAVLSSDRAERYSLGGGIYYANKDGVIEFPQDYLQGGFDAFENGMNQFAGTIRSQTAGSAPVSNPPPEKIVLTGHHYVAPDRPFKEPEGIELLARDNAWGIEKNGYRSQIIAASDQYVLGKPMKFHLVIKNVHSHLQRYDAQGLSHPHFTIIDPNGNIVPNKIPPFQTWGSGEPIYPGEIVTLMKNRDITREYVLTQPGTYTIAFSGSAWCAGPSNTVQISVLPGSAYNEDVVIERLSSVIPEKTYLHKGWMGQDTGRKIHSDYMKELSKRPKPKVEYTIDELLRDREIPKPNRIFESYGSQPGENVCLGIYASDIHRMTGENFLWISKIEDVAVEQDDEHVVVTEYLGKCEIGYVYIRPSESLLNIWPSLKQDLMRVLKIVD